MTRVNGLKIVVVDFAASEGGALSILRDFAEHVRKYYNNHKWIFLLSGNYIEKTDNIKIHLINKNRLNRLFFDDILGAKIINDMKPDIVFNLQNTFIKGVKAKQIIYLHQSIPFQKEMNFSFLKKNEFKYAVIQKLIGKRIINDLPKANGIIVQSNWMKEAIIDITKMDTSKITVIPPTINVENNRISEPMFNSFFYPATDYSYKNFDIIEKACEIINELDFNVEITIDRKLNNRHIKSIGKISREEVFQKYKNSILLFPSKIETFGMPLAEARLFNSIIFASDTKFSQEILKEYSNVYFFNSNNAQELADLLSKSINHKINHYPAEKIKQPINGWDEIIKKLITQSS